MVNFSMFAGDTKVLVVSVVDVTGQPVDITGTLIRWQLAKSVRDAAALIEKSVDDGIEITDLPGGLFTVTLNPADTLQLTGTYYYEGEIDDGGVISTVVSGYMQID